MRELKKKELTKNKALATKERKIFIRILSSLFVVLLFHRFKVSDADVLKRVRTLLDYTVF